MPAVHDLVCVDCKSVERDHFFPHSSDVEPSNCTCGGRRQILWNARWNHNHAWDARNRIVVYRSPSGELAYPGRNDIPMPERYRNQGYERVEISSLPEYNRFEKENGVMSQAMHFDNNGKVDREESNAAPMPEVKYSNLLE